MELNYKKIGQGSPLIILHGLFGSSDNWLSIAKELSNDYEIFLIDQRNHGDSPHTDDFNYELLAEDLHQFINDHQIENPFVLGHSMGGKTAMNFAIKYPEKLKALIVADIAPKQYKVHHDSILEGLMSLDLSNLKSRNQADEQLAKYIDEVGVRAFLLKNLTRDSDKKFVWKINLPVLNEKIEEVVKGLESSIKTDGPTLFISGENSNYIKDSDHDDIKAQFTNAQIVTMKGVGHWLHAEKPEEFIETLTAYLDLHQ